MVRTVAILVVLVGTAGPAFAQSTPAAFVRGFGGLTFMSEPAQVFGAGVGFRIHPNVDVIGELGRLTNVLPRELQRDLDDAAHAIGTLYGGPLAIDGKAPGVYGFGGLRVGRRIPSRATVFAEVGAGIARGTSDISARAGTTDVSRQVVAALGIDDSETRGLVAVGGGVAIPLTGHLAVDFSYRYMRIFTDDPRINTATMALGLRWGF